MCLHSVYVHFTRLSHVLLVIHFTRSSLTLLVIHSTRSSHVALVTHSVCSPQCLCAHHNACVLTTMLVCSPQCLCAHRNACVLTTMLVCSPQCLCATDIRLRVEVESVGTPLTHSRYLRRHKGSYGPAIKAGQGSFPWQATPIPGLFTVGDSTFPGALGCWQPAMPAGLSSAAGSPPGLAGLSSAAGSRPCQHAFWGAGNLTFTAPLDSIFQCLCTSHKRMATVLSGNYPP